MENVITCKDDRVTYGSLDFPCAVGSGGVLATKREGDGATPAGRFPLREVLYRPDRVANLKTALPVRALAKDDGWCDDNDDPNYNRRVKLPYTASHEELWREDEVYDIIGILGYNDDPPVSGKGSAVFLHVARPGYTPTAGCVALSEGDLIKLLAAVSAGVEIDIQPDSV